MRVLVSGLLQFDSGKTSLALSLIHEAVERGMDVGVVKPVTSFSGWYQYSSVLKSMELGKLVGEDIYKLHETAKSEDPIELESPVVLMHMPPDPERVEWRSTFYTALNLKERIISVRITNPKGTNHFYVPENLNRLTGSLRDVATKLVNTLKPKPLDVEKVDELIPKLGELADECVGTISSKHDFTLIESYNNASAPTWKSLDVDVVLIVAPSKVAIFEGKSYRKAVELLLNPPWLIPSEDIVSILRPAKTVELKPTLNKNSAWAEGLLDEIYRLFRISSNAL